MPIPGLPIPTPASTLQVPPTLSPFWLRLHGVWLQLEGVLPGVPVSTERPGSDFVSLDGRRSVQRAPIGRRSWELSLRYATPAAVAALTAAAESSEPVWLSSDAVLQANMLDPRTSAGTGPVVDCGGVPLRSLPAGREIIAPVRSGAPVTLSAWVAGTGDSVLVEYGTSAATLTASGPGRTAVTFTPAVDEVTLTVLSNVPAGLMLTEDVEAPALYSVGESMPCQVSAGDLGDTLTTYYADHYRHDYAVTVREVG